MPSHNPPADPDVFCASLGGALATILTLDLIVRGLYAPKDVWFMTFGQPRVGNHRFADCFSEHTKRSQCLRIVYKGTLACSVCCTTNSCACSVLLYCSAALLPDASSADQLRCKCANMLQVTSSQGFLSFFGCSNMSELKSRLH